MMKVIGMIVAGVIASMGALYWLAGQSLSQPFGLLRAGAATTVDYMENQIPDLVKDEKTEKELAVAREQVVDRQIQVNLSKNELTELELEIHQLKKAISERAELLGSAYPILQKAEKERQEFVRFSATSFTLADFQNEVDQLLSLQNRDELTLKIKEEGCSQLRSSIEKAEDAIFTMKNQVAEIEQEFRILKTRREHARIQADTLNSVALANKTTDSLGTSIEQTIDRLKDQVESLEATNLARSEVIATTPSNSGRLTKAFDRMTALQKYYVANNAANSENSVNNSLSRDLDSRQTSPETGEVTIHLKGQLSQDPK